MRSQRFRSLAKAEGPFASVYFDDSHDTADAADQLQTKWRDVRTRLLGLDAGTNIIDTVQEAVLNHPPTAGQHGRAVIATSDQVLINEQLISPPPNMIIRVSRYPYIVPLIDFELRRPTYVFAAVDHIGADVTLHQECTFKATTIDGAGYPVHKPATAGWHGYGDLQHTTDEAVRMNSRAVADHLTRLTDDADPEVVFLCGNARSRADVFAELPKRVARRVLQLRAKAHTRGIDSDRIDRLTAAEFAQLRTAEIAGIANRYHAEISRDAGLAAEGLAAVCAMLRAGDVETLIIGDMGDATVVTGAKLTSVAPNADLLSEFGEPVVAVERADEALPFTAIAIGASLIRDDTRFAPTDGVGALLRYRASDGLSRAI